MNRVSTIKQAAAVLAGAGIKGNVVINDDQFFLEVIKELKVNPQPEDNKRVVSQVVTTEPLTIIVSRSLHNEHE